jgi:hypothetical protein
MRGAMMKSLSANRLPDTFVSHGSVLLDLCERIEGRSTAIPIIRARCTLDAREIVAAGRAESAMAPDLAGTVVPIVVQEPQDALAGLFAVALAGGVPLVLSGSRTYESATRVQRRINDVAEKVNARFVYLHGTWQEVSKHSLPDVAHKETAPASAPMHAGDLGFIADGALVFTGRAAEVVRLAGQDFLPTEVEDLLVRTGFGKTGRVAVVGVDYDAAAQMVELVLEVKRALDIALDIGEVAVFAELTIAELSNLIVKLEDNGTGRLHTA